MILTGLIWLIYKVLCIPIMLLGFQIGRVLSYSDGIVSLMNVSSAHFFLGLGKWAGLGRFITGFIGAIIVIGAFSQDWALVDGGVFWIQRIAGATALAAFILGVGSSLTAKSLNS